MKIANKHLTVSFKAKGAELTSIKKNGLEYLWQANPKFWGRHAPVLFPIVGKLVKDAMKYRGKTYEMTQHGFARDMEFELDTHTGDEAVFSLKSSTETHKKYPFDFLLSISYRLEGSGLRVTYTVENRGDQDMYFSIGGHPAFNCPLTADESRTDYWFEFNNAEQLTTHIIEGAHFTGETEEVAAPDGKIAIRKDLFDRDALVFKNLHADRVSLCSPQKKWLTFHFGEFPYLGLWSKNQESPFVCIEPWQGLADHELHNQQFDQKEGIVRLEENGQFSCGYLIEVHD
ncbi:aldose 1-epimerase family protein [Marinoscillum furvescens]|uniref:Galactose mutarotase-like enzyme n=1 Tax=Marinoscillum furvescens DSM 4134 TaxID=1122208 RepID=A0A3D9L660_MARFU|nr:aldose 1-epimerase family protein [Marinoscillum furvescens]REE00574.1 galactose mutarotase-like enzyme [Marinoscillum furvescens DSM 4134]